jgi:hypothetical protein
MIILLLIILSFLYIFNFNFEGYWVLLVLIQLFSFLGLIYKNYRNGPSIIILVFLFTYYLAPLPYLIYDISIVPYNKFVDVQSFTNTIYVMTIFILGVYYFSKFSINLNNYKAVKNKSEYLILLYWGLIFSSTIFIFVGSPVVNIGENNFSLYQDNLNIQSGALEYYFLFMAVGYSLSDKKINKFLFIIFSIYYLYYTFVCGFRIMMLECIILSTLLFLRKFLTFRFVIVGSILGLFFMQFHDHLKWGGVNADNLFTLFVNDEIRTNQTEVFYTSNVIINSVLSNLIPFGSRFESLMLAFIAIFMPASYLPSANWHPTISMVNLTDFNVGGGGLMPTHFYYWLSVPGIILSSMVTSYVFKISNMKVKNYFYFLGVLLVATSPRWLVYEPIALLFRTTFYFSLLFFLIHWKSFVFISKK